MMTVREAAERAAQAVIDFWVERGGHPTMASIIEPIIRNAVDEAVSQYREELSSIRYAGGMSDEDDIAVVVRDLVESIDQAVGMANDNAAAIVAAEDERNSLRAELAATKADLACGLHRENLLDCLHNELRAELATLEKISRDASEYAGSVERGLRVEAEISAQAFRECEHLRAELAAMRERAEEIVVVMKQAREALDQHRCGTGSCYCCRAVNAIDAAIARQEEKS